MPSLMTIFSVLCACAFATTLGAAPTAPGALAAVGDFPIRIELDKPQLVTVVIEHAHGVRLRNLAAETQLYTAQADGPSVRSRRPVAGD